MTLALGIAAAALLVLARVGSHGPVAGGAPPLDDIDDASRLRLEQVLREADRQQEPHR